MNAKRVSDALSELNPQYVQEALQYKGRSKALRWRKWGAAAACLVVVAALVLGGTSMFARTYWSPRPRPPTYWTPLLRSRKTVPDWVPEGTV